MIFGSVYLNLKNENNSTHHVIQLINTDACNKNSKSNVTNIQHINDCNITPRTGAPVLFQIVPHNHCGNIF